MAFKYDIVTLIELVEARPCIWDKTNEVSKNKILREKCWQELFEFLETEYKEMPKVEKKKTGDVIMKKWVNIRDSFVKSLRTKTGQGFQKKYLHAEQLHFLLKVVEKADTDSNLTDSENSLTSRRLSSSSNTPEPPPLTPEPNELPPPTLPARKKKTRESDVIEREILAELKKHADKENNLAPLTSRMNEKETMLLSFLPYIKDLNETEMMDLHMQILTSIPKIKQQRTLDFRIFSKLPSPANSSNNVYLSQLSYAPTAVTQPTVTSPAEVIENDLFDNINPLPVPQKTETCTFSEENAGVNDYHLMN